MAASVSPFQPETAQPHAQAPRPNSFRLPLTRAKRTPERGAHTLRKDWDPARNGREILGMKNSLLTFGTGFANMPVENFKNSLTRGEKCMF